MASVGAITATNNADIDGLLDGERWVGAITYSFPSSPLAYTSGYGDGEPSDPSFAQIPAALQSALHFAIAQITGFTNADVSFAGTGSADIMVAQSAVADPTAWAYFPDPSPEGGDIWVGTTYDWSQAAPGNYGFFTALNLVTASLGLKNSSDTGGVANIAVPSAHDDIEYTVASSRGYVGADPNTGYSVEEFGYSQTFMANDILALQTLYGANYSAQSGNTVYTWSPTTGQEFIDGVGQLAPGDGSGGSSNRIFETIWDGGGVDTYDLSNYTTDLRIDLNPGAPSVFSTAQLAYLGDGHYASGNIYNAYLYNGDTRSYIDNATGGSGNDTIIGNAIANVLQGGSGNDTITGGGGNDTIIGGDGTDTVVYSGNRANYVIAYDAQTNVFTVADQRSGSPDGTDTVTGVENFAFADGTFSSDTLANQAAQGHTDTIYDTSNDQPWAYKILEYDGQNVLNHLTVKNDDGTSTFSDYNTSHVQNFRLAVSQYNSSSQLTSVSLYPTADPSHSLLVTAYDPQHIEQWKDAISGYDANGHIQYVTVEKWDGTSSYTKYSGEDTTIYNYASDGHLVSTVHNGTIVYA